jgi:hypothetical protein
LLWIGSKLKYITFLPNTKHLLHIFIFKHSILIGGGIPRIWVSMWAESYMCSYEWNIKSEMCAGVYFAFLLSRYLSIRSGKTIYFGNNWPLLALCDFFFTSVHSWTWKQEVPICVWLYWELVSVISEV